MTDVRRAPLLGSIALLLLGAGVQGWPPGFYLVLQLLVSGTAVYVLMHTSASRWTGWSWAMTAIAILFNPIAPVPISRGPWQIACLAAAASFAAWLLLVQGWPFRLTPARTLRGRRRPAGWRDWPGR